MHHPPLLQDRLVWLHHMNTALLSKVQVKVMGGLHSLKARRGRHLARFSQARWPICVGDGIAPIAEVQAWPRPRYRLCWLRRVKYNHQGSLLGFNKIHAMVNHQEGDRRLLHGNPTYTWRFLSAALRLILILSLVRCQCSEGSKSPAPKKGETKLWITWRDNNPTRHIIIKLANQVQK